MPRQRSVLIADNDRDIAELVRALLTDEGYAVTVLSGLTPESVTAAVGRLEPDCVLLDGESGTMGDYGASWEMAAALSARARAVPVVMFTAHRGATEEARSGSSRRAREAGFAAVVAKPFDVDAILDAVAHAVGRSEPFDGSEPADERRTDELVWRLEELGARDVRRSSRREWVTFRATDGTLLQLYWWQSEGCYYVGAYPGNGSRLETLGLFYELDAAVACAASVLLGNVAPVAPALQPSPADAGAD
ncbi:MAG TPA: response regulator [Candidatus Limnocylindria bacterium]|nr:response regulator [Candidatus Limnocylindria bacterium]